MVIVLLHFVEFINDEWVFTELQLHCALWYVTGLHKPLGCTTETNLDEGARLTYCTCDSNYCNADPPDPNGFACYAGDLDVATLEQAYLSFYLETRSNLSYTISRCYRNREQCFQMKYYGVTGERIRFGCSPLALAHLAPSDQFTIDVGWNHLAPVDQFYAGAIVKAKTCDTHLCNLPDNIGTDERTPPPTTTTAQPVTLKKWEGFSLKLQKADWVFIEKDSRDSKVEFQNTGQKTVSRLYWPVFLLSYGILYGFDI